jgi:hypothetical protein
VEGAADDPVKFPKMLSAEKFERANESAGVVVAVATEVVNRGLNVPALKLVTLPAAEMPFVHVLGSTVQYQTFCPAAASVWK